MAEERLIDDDKDRKYKIKINADGEEELVIDGEKPEEEEPSDECFFEVPEFEADDEEAAVLTPEQLAARQKARAEEEERRHAKIAERFERAQKAYSEKDFDGTLYEISEIEEDGGESGALSILKLKALTRGFTYFENGEEGISAARAVKEKATEEQKTALSEEIEFLKEKRQVVFEETEKLSEENDEKKAERRVILNDCVKKSAMAFAICAIPFVGFLIASICFSTVIHAAKNYLNLILTCAFAGAAVVFFIAMLITGKKLLDNTRTRAQNEKDGSTKLGRELIARRAELQFIDEILAATV